MTVQLNVPTGAELRAHVERWEALPEGERPKYPAMVWAWHYQRWEPEDLFHSLYRLPDDDTPQPGLRLVPLPTPVGDGWRRPVDEAEARTARVADVLQRDYPPAPSQPTGWGRCGWAVGQIEGTKGFRVPVSWEPGRERVEVGQHRGRTIGGKSIHGIHPVPSPPRLVLDDPGASTAVATVIGGTAWVWVDPIEAPETERVPWWEAVGRLDPEDGRIIAVEKVDGGAPRAFFDEEAWMLVKAADGTVEVLVESGEFSGGREQEADRRKAMER